MKNPRRILLKNSDPPVILFVSDNLVTYEPHDGEELKTFTLSHQRIVRKLASHLNEPVSYAELYQAYQEDDYIAPDASEKLQKMRVKLPAPIKRSMITRSGMGYMLLGDELDDPQKNAHTDDDLCNRLSILNGDYYGFFLDPVGSGDVLGAYLHIDGNGDKCTALLGIRSDDVLFGDDLADIFQAEEAERYQRYEAFNEACSPNDRRCFWATGTVQLVETTVQIAMTTSKGYTWMLWFELGNFLKGKRSKHHNDNGQYRGGMGLSVAAATHYGTFANKFGLVRKTFYKESISLKNPQIATLLKHSETNDCTPLIAEPRCDNRWYSWFMKE